MLYVLICDGKNKVKMIKLKVCDEIKGENVRLISSVVGLSDGEIWTTHRGVNPCGVSRREVWRPDASDTGAKSLSCKIK
jgi:hypothetical protein